MGGIRYRTLNHITKQIWEWCQKRDIWIFAEYVVSKDNLADGGFRVNNIDIEWELADYAFQRIVKSFGEPSIDLFATRINNRCNKYCSWERDPEAYAINAFTIGWKEEFWYAFPPFSLIIKVLKKVREEGSTGILVVPFWTTQPWFPEFKRLLISNTITFEPSEKLLNSPAFDMVICSSASRHKQEEEVNSPCRKVIHPLSSTLTPVSGVVSGGHSSKRTWRRTR